MRIDRLRDGSSRACEPPGLQRAARGDHRRASSSPDSASPRTSLPNASRQPHADPGGADPPARRALRPDRAPARHLRHADQHRRASPMPSSCASRWSAPRCASRPSVPIAATLLPCEGLIRRQEEVRSRGELRALRAARRRVPRGDLRDRPAARVAWEVAQRVKGHLSRVRRLSLPAAELPIDEMVVEHRAVLDALPPRLA